MLKIILTTDGSIGYVKSDMCCKIIPASSVGVNTNCTAPCVADGGVD